MTLNILLTLSSIYLALVGLGYLVKPDALLFGTLGPDTSAALIANLRGPASTFLGIAVLNWIARNAEPSKARTAIIWGNIVGFALAGVLDVLAVFSGGPVVELVPGIINLLIAAGFFWFSRESLSVKAS
jgi:hypothetical protein